MKNEKTSVLDNLNGIYTEERAQEIEQEIKETRNRHKLMHSNRNVKTLQTY